MTDKKKAKKRSRVKIGQPKGEANELTPADMKKVKGGFTGGVNVAMGDGSVRSIDGSVRSIKYDISDGTSNAILKPKG